MRLNRSMILIVLAFLTVCFLGAAYTLWFNPTGLPLVGAGSLMPGEPEPAAESPSATNGVKLTVAETGIAAVTATQLRNAGFNFSKLSSDELLLLRGDEPVPFHVRENDEESTLYFYAEVEQNPHKPLAVYELRKGTGIKMFERDAQPFNEGTAEARHLLQWEDNRLFVEDGTPGDAWMGPILAAPDRWTLRLNTIRPNGKGASLTVRLFTNIEAVDDDQHHVEILVNDVTVAEHFWQGAGQEIVRVPLQPGLLKADDSNTVSIIVPDDTAPEGEAIYVDSLELGYDGPIDVSGRAATFISSAPNLRVDGASGEVLVFDISDPMTPIALTGIRPEGDSVHFSPGGRESRLIALNAARAIKPSVEAATEWERALRDPQRGADYIAIVADVRGFDEAIAPLLAHREEQGLRVEKVPLVQIFDEFSNGQRDPQAIKDFIAYVVQYWEKPAPRYVLLVGDATHDLTNQIQGKNRNRLPTQLVYTLEGGYVADDGWLAANGDKPASVAIGRFPAQNAPQLRAMINKTIDYENDLGQADAAWTAEALLVADHESEYEADAAELAAFLEAEGYSVYRVHMSHDENAHYKIISALDQGVGIVNYMGSGSESAWSDEAIFQSSDVQILQNGEKLPILSTFTAPSGSFADPRIDSLAESMLRANYAGIIAAVAPSGPLAPEYQQEITDLFFREFTADDALRLGDSLVNMYDAAAETPLLQDAMAPVNLLGDPALLIGKPRNN